MLTDCMTVWDLLAALMREGAIWSLIWDQEVRAILSTGTEVIYRYVPEYHHYCTLGELL